MLIEMWSDVVCPWCYVGKRRLDAALATLPEAGAAEVVFRSFELDPTAPRERDSHAADLATKYGMSVAQVDQAHAEFAAMAKPDGIEFRFDAVRSGNTFDAHRLLHLARAHGIQPRLAETFMRAVFTEGTPIGDRQTLAGLAVAAGLPDAEVRDVLDTDRYADDVRADEGRARRLGVRGVPFYLIDSTRAISGAQPVAALAGALRAAAEPAHR